MVFGGALNADGTNYLKELRRIDNIISFLEKLKKRLEQNEKKCVDKTVDILVKYGNKLVEKNKKED